MSGQNSAIVNPKKGKNAPDLGPVAVMVSSDADLRTFCRAARVNSDSFSDLLMGKIYLCQDVPDISITGPIIGAPYAAIILETLIAWGARKIIFFGWCGAIAPQVRIGDIILPAGSFIDEGTSRHYNDQAGEKSAPSGYILQKVRSTLSDKGLAFHEGSVWSTDAIFRETEEKIRHYQSRDVLAVDMETSALFTIGAFRNVDVGAVLVVSDDLSDLTWRPGFKEKRFRDSRRRAADLIGLLCRSL